MDWEGALFAFVRGNELIQIVVKVFEIGIVHFLLATGISSMGHYISNLFI